jgi:Spy/CpxP family protein refolding chaperone
MKEGLDALGRVRAQGIALLFITFLVGVLAGFAAERVRAARASPQDEPPPGTAFRPGRLPPMFRHLDLTPEQRERILAILAARRPETQEILDEMLPRLRAVTEATHREIRAVLSPEQAAVYDSLLLHMHGRRRMMRPRMQGPEPGPGGPGSEDRPPPHQ